MVNVILFMVAVIIFFMFWRVLLPVVLLIKIVIGGFYGKIFYDQH